MKKGLLLILFSLISFTSIYGIRTTVKPADHHKCGTNKGKHKKCIENLVRNHCQKFSYDNCCSGCKPPAECTCECDLPEVEHKDNQAGMIG